MSRTAKSKNNPDEESKNRSYTPQERSLLKQILRKYASIIESKKSDAASLHEKSEVWALVTRNYNASHYTTCKRTQGQLRKLWSNMKSDRKKSLIKRKETFCSTESMPESEISKVDIGTDIKLLAPSDTVQAPCVFSSNVSDIEFEERRKTLVSNGIRNTIEINELPEEEYISEAFLVTQNSTIGNSLEMGMQNLNNTEELKGLSADPATENNCKESDEEMSSTPIYIEFEESNAEEVDPSSKNGFFDNEKYQNKEERLAQIPKSNFVIRSAITGRSKSSETRKKININTEIIDEEKQLKIRRLRLIIQNEQEMAEMRKKNEEEMYEFRKREEKEMAEIKKKREQEMYEFQKLEAKLMLEIRIEHEKRMNEISVQHLLLKNSLEIEKMKES